MKRFSYRFLLCAIVLVAAPIAEAMAQQTPTPVPLAAPPGPVSRFPSRFMVLDAPEQFDQVLLIVDFPAETWTLPYAPSGYVYSTLIEGELTLRTVATAEELLLAPGDTFVATPEQMIELGNRGTDKARLVSTAVLPTGAALAIDAAGVASDVYPAYAGESMTSAGDRVAGAPITVHRSSIEVSVPAPAFELVQLVLDFQPGVWTPPHMHGGQELVTTTAGELTVRRRGGVERFTAGESWVNTTALVHAAGNDGEAFAQAVGTFMLPVGATLTTVQPAALLNTP